MTSTDGVFVDSPGHPVRLCVHQIRRLVRGTVNESIIPNSIQNQHNFSEQSAALFFTVCSLFFIFFLSEKNTCFLLLFFVCFVFVFVFLVWYNLYYEILSSAVSLCTSEDSAIRKLSSSFNYYYGIYNWYVCLVIKLLSIIMLLTFVLHVFTLMTVSWITLWGMIKVYWLDLTCLVKDD